MVYFQVRGEYDSSEIDAACGSCAASSDGSGMLSPGRQMTTDAEQDAIGSLQMLCLFSFKPRAEEDGIQAVDW